MLAESRCGCANTNFVFLAIADSGGFALVVDNVAPVLDVKFIFAAVDADGKMGEVAAGIGVGTRRGLRRGIFASGSSSWSSRDDNCRARASGTAPAFSDKSGRLSRCEM